MKLAISGASGQLGQLVADELLKSPEVDLVLATRTPDSLAGFAQRGAEVRHGDFTDPASLADAFAGSERLLMISTDLVGSRMPLHRAAIEAAVAAGVQQISYLSFLAPTLDNPAAAAAEHFETEKLIRESGLTWTFLRNSIYADLQAAELAAARQGTIRTNAGEGRVAYVSRQDCAAAAAAVLAGGDHGGQAYDITGPQLLSARDRAALFAEMLERPVEVVDVDDEEAAEGIATATGLPLEECRSFASYGRAIREGRFETVTGTVRELTGRAPQSLREVLDGAAVA